MANDQPKRHRRSVRLQDYNYSQSGAYFVTICTHERKCMFGEIVDGAMQLNDAGIMADQCWSDIPKHFPQVDLDAFVVMPNHVHGIIVVAEGPVGAKDFSPLHKTNNTRSRATGAPSKSIGSIIRGFKIGVTKWFRENTGTHSVWQRNYYEHVVRNEESLDHIRQYILDTHLGGHSIVKIPRQLRRNRRMRGFHNLVAQRTSVDCYGFVGAKNISPNPVSAEFTSKLPRQIIAAFPSGAPATDK